MKVIKKITAIMLSIMMVLGMSSVVSAEGTSGTGKITISNAVVGQTYNIYKILDLESYNDADPNNEHYAYKAVSEWKTFLTGTEIKGTYVDVDSDGYVTWKTGADAAKFAKKALAYAKDTTTTPPITAMSTKIANTTTVEFTGLDSGYYLVDSSVGTLCFLDTMKSGEVKIDEKNVAPTVEKKVQEDSTNNYDNSNTADIGQTVNFKTTITAQAGAQNYVLHDKMDAGLTFDESTVKVQRKVGSEAATNVNSGYTVKKDSLGESTSNVCTFHIEFDQTFCDTLQANEKIIITYSATLNKDATVGTTGNKNETWLKYGENKNLETAPSETTTKTYEIPVFKYTLDTNGTTKKGLGGAIFKLTKTDGETATSIELIKTSTGTGKDTYRVAKSGETGTVKTITTSSIGGDKGKFTIQGLDADTYYLTETKQPDGYNKLSKAVKIEIDKDGNIKVDDIAIAAGEDVKVENKSGSLLPSTGGRGTTLFYILGAILVVGSGVVLITKKRMK
mgnify:CR=1 FL=1